MRLLELGLWQLSFPVHLVVLVKVAQGLAEKDHLVTLLEARRNVALLDQVLKKFCLHPLRAPPRVGVQVAVIAALVRRLLVPVHPMKALLGPLTGKALHLADARLPPDQAEDRQTLEDLLRVDLRLEAPDQAEDHVKCKRMNSPLLLTCWMV